MSYRWLIQISTLLVVLLALTASHCEANLQAKSYSSSRQLLHDIRRFIRDNGIADLDVYDDSNNIPSLSPDNSDTRTFGLGVARRRMQFAMMLPIVYKLGVITTLLTVLTVLSVKGVTIGLILLMFAIISAVSKSKYHHLSPPASFHHWSADVDPFDRSDQQLSQYKQDKNIHVHVHAAVPSFPTANAFSPIKGSGEIIRDSAEITGGGGIPSTGSNGALPYSWNRSVGSGSNEQLDFYYGNSIGPNYNSNNNRFNIEQPTTSSYYNRWIG
ncbi:uncharacterized protein LOC126899064 [Daktulosphaira vitifoliae]|uniref:uncharacterized protein LOC126899064 n=1 Tax=Daktulosphaira vitifoliae TaxID=58002 RepID=UPI0021AA733C|nr:uncharacterized protein LOC126899064 [Daktulosphaira vitifoliae]